MLALATPTHRPDTPFPWRWRILNGEHRDVEFCASDPWTCEGAWGQDRQVEFHPEDQFAACTVDVETIKEGACRTSSTTPSF